MRTDIDKLTLGIYYLALFAAAVVLALVIEFVAFCRDAMRTPISAATNERWWPQFDRRVLFRLAVVGGAAVLAFAAAAVVGHSLDPRQTKWVLTRPFNGHPEWLLPFGAVFCVVALLSGVKPRQSCCCSASRCRAS